MKSPPPALSLMVLMLMCSLPGRLSAATPPAATAAATSQAPTETSLPPTSTPLPPSATPLPPPITANTVNGLTPFMSFADGELVRSLAFSPDGAELAAAVGDEAGYVRLYDAENGLPLRTLEGHESIVWGLAFSPDGRLLASAARDKTARVWDAYNGSLIQSLDFPNEVTSVAFSPDSQTLAVGGVAQWPDAAIWTYAVGSWQPLMKLEEFWNIPDIAFSPDGTMLVGGGTSRNVRVWRTSDGAQRWILYHAGQVSSLAISPDGATVATGSCEASEANQCTRGGVWLWDLASGKLIQKLSDFPDGVVGVTFSLDGSVIFGGSRDGTLRAYATSDYSPLLVTTSPWAGSSIRILALTVSPDGRFVATGGIGRIILWKIGP